MSKIAELRERQQKLVAEARERLDQITSETDEGRAKELETQHDAAMAEYDKLEKVIERETKLEALEKRAAERRAEQRPISGSDAEARGQDEGKKLEYRQVFHSFLAKGGSLEELSQEERNILKAGVIPAAEHRAQTTSNTAGGYTVPTELANILVKSMKMWGPMYDEDICTVFNTSSGNPIPLPTVDDTAVTAGAHSEGVALTDDGGKDVTFGQKNLNAYVYDTEFVRFSMELAQDSIFNMENLLGNLLGERLGRIANQQLTTGDGTDDPNGVVTASSLGKTAAAQAAITSDEIIDLVHSVDPAYRQSPKVRFMMNDLTLAAIRKLKDGEGRYIWSSGDVQKGVPGTLYGYIYSINQAMASIATGNKTVLFGDFGKYYVRKVGAPAIGVLRERFWPDLGIAGLVRLDGELGDTAAVKHLIQA